MKISRLAALLLAAVLTVPFCGGCTDGPGGHRGPPDLVVGSQKDALSMRDTMTIMVLTLLSHTCFKEILEIGFYQTRLVLPLSN